MRVWESKESNFTPEKGLKMINVLKKKPFPSNKTMEKGDPPFHSIAPFKSVIDLVTIVLVLMLFIFFFKMSKSEHLKWKHLDSVNFFLVFFLWLFIRSWWCLLKRTRQMNLPPLHSHSASMCTSSPWHLVTALAVAPWHFHSCRGLCLWHGSLLKVLMMGHWFDFIVMIY